MSILFDPIKVKIVSLIKEAIERQNVSGAVKELEKFVEAPTDASMGEFALPCFRLAKEFRKSPIDIANTIKKEILENNAKNAKDDQLVWIKEIVVVNGYLNFKINYSRLAEELLPEIESGNFLSPEKIDNSLAVINKEKIMIEYSQPNTHKEFHVGHGRNVCLGNYFYRLYKYFNYDTLGANYIGDEGTHIAKCLYAITRTKEKIPEENKAEWLGKKYVEANQLLESAKAQNDEGPAKEVSQILADIENQSGSFYQLWKETRQYCLDDFNQIYKWLDVHFDLYFYESEVSKEAQRIIDYYLSKGIFQKSEGAIGLDMSNDGLGFMMVRKSDGNSLYITKDIALAELKFNKYHIEKNIYVVGNEQEYHFKQLFNFFKKANFEFADKCYHLSYGMVRRADGKMSSRLGNSFTFLELIELMKKAVSPYLEKYKDEWSEKQITETAEAVTLGAIKYGMLNTDPKKDIVFEPENWANFEGNTGSYLMYGYARACSILSKAENLGVKPDFTKLALLDNQFEKELLINFYRFNSIAYTSLEQFNPSPFTHYLHKMCQIFNQYYANVSILKEPNADILTARLALLRSFTKILGTGLSLLGIRAIEKL